MHEQTSKRATRRTGPARPAFERVALLLQGGGALGSYQGGVYEALTAADLHPDTVAGISIGAINAALIAGNPPAERTGAIRAFWETITAPPLGFPIVGSMLGMFELGGDAMHGFLNQAHAMLTTVSGAPGFFLPRTLSPLLVPFPKLAEDSFYDTAPLKQTLEALVDFDRINSAEMWFAVGAVNICTGALEYFDNSTHKIRAEHVMASGALPPGFPAVEIDGQSYWDGGLLSNTPLEWVLNSRSRKDTLAFQIDLWSSAGALPRNLVEIDLRQKDIRFSSRTRANTAHFRAEQRNRRAVHRLLQMVPDQKMLEDPDLQTLVHGADDKVYNLVHLIYRAKRYEGASKDYEFSRDTMEAHWAAGVADAERSLAHPDVLKRPETPDGVAIYDLTQ